MLQTPPEVLEREAREDKAWMKALAEVEQESGQTAAEGEYSPERFRKGIEGNSDRELLMHRRFTAKTICGAVSSAGLLNITPLYEDLPGAFERLRIMDVEMHRRHLDGGQS